MTHPTRPTDPIPPARPPLDVDALRRDLLAPAGPLARLDVVDTSPSTSTALVEGARAHDGGPGWPSPALLVAEHQVAGRGRAGRSWQTPARAALTASLLLRPRLAPAAVGWLPLAAGLAVARTARSALPDGAPGALLKWPNDVLLPAARPVAGLGAHRKVAGVLAEVVPGPAGRMPDGLAVVVGVGLNVHQRDDELPVVGATSLAAATDGEASTDRTVLLTRLVRELVDAVGRLESAAGDAAAAGLAAQYADLSATLGTRVRAELAGGGGDVVGVATRVAPDGGLVLDTATGERTVTAGDVHHLRAAPDPQGGRAGGQGAPR